ncbi:MAG TPA: dTDP-4-dehydrorhamnose reductase [Candidatus Hydrogenedentes bacterium]|nr:dTDP-4-dehydrorhamnose reductase [Candidatus Hydrogenedentota bacterium]
MRTVIFGAKGQLGRDLTIVFGEAGEVYGYDLPELDVADAAAVAAAIQRVRPDTVLNAAAFTDVEGAEDHEGEAFRVNETGAGAVAAAAAANGAPVVYYSTDYVFGGTKSTPYVPDDNVAPIGVYARSKAAGEAATRTANPNHFIVRTAWLYGPGGNNFVEKILQLAATRSELKCVADEVGSPTHTWDLAQATLALCTSDAYGTFHAVNAGACSRFEFAQATLELVGAKTTLIPCASSEFPTKATRPLYSVLSTQKLEEAAHYRMRPWLEALRHYVSRRGTTQ